MRVKYGVPGNWRGVWCDKNLEGGEASIWWRDLGRLEGGRFKKRGLDSIIKKIGCGSETFFRNESWIVQQPLSSLFPRLYSISSQKDAVVAELGAWNTGKWNWNLRWRRGLFVWEENLVNTLLEVLDSAVVVENKEDSWVWKG